MNIFVFVGNQANRTIWTFSEEGFENYLNENPEINVRFADKNTPYTNHELNVWLSDSDDEKRMLVVKGEVIIPRKTEAVKTIWSMVNPQKPLDRL